MHSHLHLRRPACVAVYDGLLQPKPMAGHAAVEHSCPRSPKPLPPVIPITDSPCPPPSSPLKPCFPPFAAQEGGPAFPIISERVIFLRGSPVGADSRGVGIAKLNVLKWTGVGPPLSTAVTSRPPPPVAMPQRPSQYVPKGARNGQTAPTQDEWDVCEGLKGHAVDTNHPLGVQPIASEG